MEVPSFLARQFYVAGSLRNTPSGFRLEARNPLGAGTLVGVGRIAVDGQVIAPEAVAALREGDAEPIRASEVSRFRPIRVAVGDRVTLLVDGERLPAGTHRLEVELFELNLGALRFAISDPVAEA